MRIVTVIAGSCFIAGGLLMARMTLFVGSLMMEKWDKLSAGSFALGIVSLLLGAFFAIFLVFQGLKAVGRK